MEKSGIFNFSFLQNIRPKIPKQRVDFDIILYNYQNALFSYFSLGNEDKWSKSKKTECVQIIYIFQINQWELNIIFHQFGGFYVFQWLMLVTLSICK